MLFYQPNYSSPTFNFQRIPDEVCAVCHDHKPVIRAWQLPIDNLHVQAPYCINCMVLTRWVRDGMIAALNSGPNPYIKISCGNQRRKSVIFAKIWNLMHGVNDIWYSQVALKRHSKIVMNEIVVDFPHNCG